VVLTGDRDRQIAVSALDVLEQTGQLDRLQPWFEGQPDNPLEARKPGQTAGDAVSQKLALRMPAPPALAGTQILFSVASPPAIALPGEPGTLIGPLSVNSQQRQNFETDAGQLSVGLAGKQVEVLIGGTRIAAFDLTATLDGLKAQAAPPAGQPPVPQRKAITLDGVGGSKARLAITFVSGTVADSQASLQLTGYLLLPATP
jgi:hypothetical protein